MSQITIELPQPYYDILKQNAKDNCRSLRTYATSQLMKIAKDELVDVSSLDELRNIKLFII